MACFTHSADSHLSLNCITMTERPGFNLFCHIDDAGGKDIGHSASGVGVGTMVFGFEVVRLCSSA